MNTHWKKHFVRKPHNESCSSGKSEHSSISPTVFLDAGTPVNMEMNSDEPRVQEMEVKPLSLCAGYKIVFDNLDKTIKPRFMGADYQAKLHFVHSYATKNRIDFSKFSDEIPTEVNIWDIIPNEVDYPSLKWFCYRMIVEQHIPFLGSDYERLPLQHTPHKFSKEMSKKSEVVKC